MISKQCFLCKTWILTLDFPEGEGGSGGEGKDPPDVLCITCQGKVRDKARTSELIRNQRARRSYEQSK